MGSYHMQPYPVCISRPTGVGAVAKTPCPGYIGNSAAATAMILSIACGRQAYMSAKRILHVFPSDCCIEHFSSKSALCHHSTVHASTS